MSQQSSSPAGAPERVTRIIDNAKSLARQDVDLLKQQVRRTAQHGGAAAGAGGAAAVLALFVVGFLGMAGGAALTQYTRLHDWAAWLVVAGVFLLFALVALLVARAQANNAATASQVATSQIKEDVQWAKQQIKP